MAFLGCSRGLGQAVTLEMDRKLELSQALLFARNETSLEKLSHNLQVQAEVLGVDFANPLSVDTVMESFRRAQPSRIFYFAGGGPFGLFSQKAWKDHLWALQVSFLTPSEILHRLLSDAEFSFVRQIVFVGSMVADSRPDPLASSYASAKHGLKGLIESLQGENLAVDLRFFRPGYMNTDLLPKNARPRQEGMVLADPKDVAVDFVKWALDSEGTPIYDALA